MNQTLLVQEEKYWPSIGKWCVSFWSPEYVQIANDFNKDREVARRNALERIKKHIKFQKEYRATSGKSEIMVTI